MRRFGILALTMSLLVLSAGPAHAKLPVDYNFFSGIPYELRNPGGSLPGSNDWNCKPTAAHPNPVVLVHGTGGGAQTNWGVYVPLLANEGYCVYALNYGALALPWPLSAIGGMRTLTESVAELDGFVKRVLVATGAAEVDIIGHSQGNAVANYWAKSHGGDAKLDKLISVAPAHLGSNTLWAGDIMAFLRALGAEALAQVAVLGMCIACLELTQGSPFLTAANARGVYAPGVTYTNIATRYDEIVVPYTNGLVPGPNATNIVLQDSCAQDYSEHAGIAGSPRAAAFALNALDPAHPRPVPCEFVPPFTG